jgi:hypothetical protein
VFFITILGILMMASTALAEIKVYDANDQYLGILMDTSVRGEASLCTIYLPNLQKYFVLHREEPDSTTADIEITEMRSECDDCIPGYFCYFESTDCTGPGWKVYEPYNTADFSDKQQIYKVGDNHYVTGSDPIRFTAKSSFWDDNGSCDCWPAYETIWYTNPIDFPKEQIPFNLPVALPLRYEYVEATPPQAVPSPVVTSFLINNGYASTTAVKVRLYNKATNNPTHYMASEDLSFTNAVWITYSTSPYFTLSIGNGTKTIYFKVKNSWGESGIGVDSILKR